MDMEPKRGVQFPSDGTALAVQGDELVDGSLARANASVGRCRTAFIWARAICGGSLHRSVWGWAPNDWGAACTARTGEQEHVSLGAEPARRRLGTNCLSVHGYAHAFAPPAFYRLPLQRHRWG